ncbi:sodium/phosphate symporter [Natrononativus amylolyticus]|uniref:sodium/phosphate symporter n=1 Tax=Natrononativus amylolyticus TaxID=2963434 RepID=UPI0020CEF355|nr:sodium/phosphate symporter [Natrononativus amylolyticus]
MTDRRYGVAAFAVLAIAIAARLLPLHWTSYPFNPDGFVFAARAGEITADGGLVLPSGSPHGHAYSVFLSVTSQLTGVDPVWLAQPTIAVIGAVPPLIAFLLVTRLGTTITTDRRALLVAGTTAGVVLAVEGVYLRRTVTVSYEVLGLLLVAVLAITTVRALETRRPAWIVLTLVALAVLPVTHHLSTMLAALTVTAVVAGYGFRRPTRVVPGVVVVGGFWLYFGTYYALTRPPYTGDLTAKPGLFVAWVVVLVAFVGWLTTTGGRATRLLVGAVGATGFSILAADALLSLFPGTMSVPPTLLFYVAPLTVLAALAAWAIPYGVGPAGDRLVVVGLLTAPIAWVGFAVTAGLTPEYVLFARRGQTFVHLAAVVLAGLAILALGRYAVRRRRSIAPWVHTGVPVLLCLCALVSMPLAFAGLEALAYQGTTTHEEFETLSFATDATPEWTSDDHLTRVASNYYGTNASPGPTYEWLEGDGALACPTVFQRSWQTVGAQQYPSEPVTVETDRYEATALEGHAVYATTGSDRLTMVVPRGGYGC